MFSPDRHTLLTLTDGHAHRDAGLDRRLAAGDLALAGHEHLAHDDVLDLLGRHAGALERGSDGEPAEFCSGERASAPLILPIGVRAPATMYEPSEAMPQRYPTPHTPKMPGIVRAARQIRADFGCG